FLQVRDVAEAAACRVARRGLGQSGLPIIGLAHREVERDFILEIALEAPAPDDRDQTMPEISRHRSRSTPKCRRFFTFRRSQAVCITRLTAAATRSQYADSVSSSRRPSAVNR